MWRYTTYKAWKQPLLACSKFRHFSSSPPVAVAGRLERNDTQPTRPFWKLKDTEKIQVRLGEMRHVKWGFIFYRCTYSDDSSWQRFMDIVRHRAELDVHETGGSDINSSLEISSCEDRSEFEGATIDQIREHFENWVCDSSRSILQEQGPDANPYPTARYTYPIHVDAEAMYSVVESAPQPPARDKDGVGYVNLINSYWRPQETSSQCEEGFHEQDGNDDVGYMRVCLQGLHPRVYSLLSSADAYHVFYRPPPQVFIR